MLKKNFRSLYQKVMDMAARPNARYWLGVISFIESSFFPIPADVMFVPMAMADRKNAYQLALIATVTSVLGALFGYMIGFYAYESVALPVLESLGKAEAFNYYRELIHGDLFLLWGLLLSSGLTHIPPIKVVTILAGVAHIDLLSFIISAIIGRGARFYFLAFLFKKYGEEIKASIEKHTVTFTICLIVFMICLYSVIKLI